MCGERARFLLPAARAVRCVEAWAVRRAQVSSLPAAPLDAVQCRGTVEAFSRDVLNLGGKEAASLKWPGARRASGLACFANHCQCHRISGVWVGDFVLASNRPQRFVF